MILTFFSKLEAFIVVAIVMHMIGAIYARSNASDHIALLEIKAKIEDDPRGALTSWNESFHFCQWRGVTCGRRHQRVTILNLQDMGLVGSISPYLGNMSFLRYITFDNNQLHGNVPPVICHLYRLQFSVEDKCTLYFAKNHLTGGIPPSLGNLTSLENLSLSYCQLGGSIPDSFQQLKKLRKIGLGENDLVGAFPSFLLNFSMLEILSIPENQLQGSLPSNLCLSQPYLMHIGLGTNQFNGFLPPSISNCSQLELLDVSNNDFKGEIVISFGRVQRLRFLSFGGNNFGSKNLDDMKFLHSLSNCSNLEIMKLSSNRLRGILPDSLGNFSSKLSCLGMDSNYILGSIPSSIRNLFGLTTISLGSNNLIGMIPESIGKLQNLQVLYLDFNYLYGVIPRSIGNLSLVTKMTLGGNNLEGNIPSTIERCKSLIDLDLYGNNLSGSVPKELFQLSSLSIGLDLSQNNMSGVLPQEIGNLKLLGSLDFSMNRFIGELPSSLSSCISLQNLNLSGNFFSGSMLESFSSLKGLEYVDLSRNNISGHIPTYLQQIHLKHLDLSYNNFEGDVPLKGVFANTSAISVIGNTRLCGGVTELHLPKCTSTTNDFKKSTKNLSLRIVIAISALSNILGFGMLSFVLFYQCIKKKRDKPLELTFAKSFEKISYGRLFKATDGFSSENLIGTGSFASVYKGVLEENGFIVAIKVLNLQIRGGLKSFMAECAALRNIRHRNLVKVITSCSSVDFQGNDFKALVYDFMPNGSLENWLYSRNQNLDLLQRINIIKDVACALDYLHCHCENVIIHCDLKPNNVLLDANMVAHVGDFGLAKILSVEEGSNANKGSSNIIRGTIGYAPPEYGLGKEVSTAGDIYSYGILLLETLIGKKPVDPMFEGELTLHSYAKSALSNGYVLQIMDPVLLNEDVNEKFLVSLIKIGVQCSEESPKVRMDIGTVVHELFATNVAT